MKPTVTKTVKRDYCVVITEDELRKRFRLPADAVIRFELAGDGYEIGESLTATWSREK